MPFEGQGDSWYGQSPGGFEFGIQGFTYGQPVPKSITFFLDGSAMICDQYGRCIRRAVSESGLELRFADCAPDGNKDGVIVPRPQFATHAQVVEALKSEHIDWLSYEVKWRDKSNSQKIKTNLSQADAIKLQTKLLQDGNPLVLVSRTISCAGWPQLSYDELKKLPEVPVTPSEELEKIRDPLLRKAALRIKNESVSAREREAAESVG